MRLDEAQSILKETSGKSYTWLTQWGLSLIQEAIRTVHELTARLEDIHEATRNARREDDISDLIEGLERAVDLFDDIQERKAEEK